jgi:hypothetical protein
VSDYPECDKLVAAAERTNVIGEFIDWLQSQGVQLMIWREDLTDIRPTDPDCHDRKYARREGREAKLRCNPSSGSVVRGDWWTAHCMHWQDPNLEADPQAQRGTCCHCGRGQEYEVTGIGSWVHEQRGTEQLLADWAGIDLKAVEAERRRMLDSLRAET